jgi:RNA polymerase sigma-70 factor (ECF subfamily)
MTRGGPKELGGAARVVNGPGVAASNEGADLAPSENDLALVQRAQAGDAEAFRLLFDRYHRRVFAVALGVVKNPQDARDVVQEAFVKVYKHLGTFQGASSFYTWLYRITMNLSIDMMRRRKSSRVVEYDDALKRDGEETDDPGNLIPATLAGDPGKTQGRRELADKIHAALATLPEYHRQVILLREVEGLSYEEIAKVMKVPKGTIMSRLFHARRKMQAALADYVDGELKPQEDGDDDATR